MKLTFPKWGLGSPSRFPKLQSLIAGVKTPRIGVFFISLENYQSVNVENDLAWAIWTSITQVMEKRRTGVKLAVWFPTTKSRELTWPWCVQVKCDTPLESSQGELQVCFRPHPNQRFEQKSYDLTKSREFKPGQFQDSFLGSPGTKSHSDVGAVERHREYYMGEGGGFPRVRVVVSLVSLRLPVVCPSTKGVPESELTNLLVGLMQFRVSN